MYMLFWFHVIIVYNYKSYPDQTFFFVSNLSNAISDLEFRINELKELQERERELEELKQQLRGKKVWYGKRYALISSSKSYKKICKEGKAMVILIIMK